MNAFQAMAILLSVIVVFMGAFVLYVRLLRPLQSGWLVTEILHPWGEVKRYPRKINNDAVKVGQHLYDVIANTKDQVFIYRTGWARRPTSFYIEGIRIPKDWMETAPELNDDTSSFVNNEKFDNHIASDLMASFRKPLIDAVTSLMLLLIGMMGGFGLLWWFQNQNTERILEAIKGG